MREPHYVECHVIVRDDPEGKCLHTVMSHGYWGSRLNEDGSGEEEPGDIILTTRRNTSDAAIEAIREITALLRAEGFVVTRGKAEVVTFDTKYGDSLPGIGENSGKSS